ncbi:MAG: WD40/YVTN/BNR-like repeat-containing protein, partial [Bacteroidia bacterium]
MRNVSSYLFLAICLFLPAGSSAQSLSQILTSSKNFYEIQAQAKSYFESQPTEEKPFLEKESSEYAKYRQWEWFWKSRINEDGSFPDIQGGEALQMAQNQQKTSTQPDWTFISQTVCDGGYNGMGRASGIAFHPTDVNTFYVASPIGGIWKTTNGGATYTSLGAGMGYGGASNLLIDYTNPNIMYCSNGDHSGWWTYSMGIYKSTDAGQTWTSAGLNWSLANNVAISKLTMSPSDPKVLFAATTLGLYRTTNGGTNW